MSEAEEILNEKETYNFLKGAKRIYVKIAMQEHTNQTLDELKEKVDKLKVWGRIQNMGDEVIRKEDVIKLIDEVTQ